MSAQSDSDEAEAAMRETMGFSNFGTSGSKARGSSSNKKNEDGGKSCFSHSLGNCSDSCLLLVRRFEPVLSW